MSEQNPIDEALRALGDVRDAIDEHQRHIHNDHVHRACGNFAIMRTYVEEVLHRVRYFESVRNRLYAHGDFQKAMGEIGQSAQVFGRLFEVVVGYHENDQDDRAADEVQVVLCQDLFQLSRAMTDRRNALRVALGVVLDADKDLTADEKLGLRRIGADHLHEMPIADVRTRLRTLTETAAESVRRLDDLAADTAIDQTCKVAVLAAEFVEAAVAVDRIGDELCGALEVDLAFRQALTKLSEVASVFESALKTLALSSYVNTRTVGDKAEFDSHRDRMRDDERELRGQLGQVCVAFADVLAVTKIREDAYRTEALEVSQRLLVDLRVFNNRDESHRTEADRAVHAAERAEVALEKTKLAAGDGGAGNQAEAFLRNSAEEKQLADYYRWITMVLLATLVVGAVAVGLAIATQLTGPTVSEIVAKLTVAIPAGILIGYTGREAARHRAEERWYRDLGMKLQTLPAYIEPLDKAEQAVFRRDLGAQVFTTPRTSKNDDPPPAGIYGELVSVLGQVGEVLKGLKGSGNDAPGDGGDGGGSSGAPRSSPTG